MVRQTFEGTWEQITREHAASLQGRRVRLVVLDDNPAAPVSVRPEPLASRMKNYIGSGNSGKPHKTARNHKKIFAEIMDEKQRKRTSK